LGIVTSLAVGPGRTTSEEDLRIGHQPPEFRDALVREIGAQQIDGAKAFQLHQMR
jgi:hypothetical protein